jgi:hypothetical protein
MLIQAALTSIPSIVRLIATAQANKSMTDEQFIAAMSRRQLAMQRSLSADITRRNTKRATRKPAVRKVVLKKRR